MSSLEESIQQLLKDNVEIKEKLKKLETLDEIRSDVSQIKQEHADFKNALSAIDERVKKIEVRMVELDEQEERLPHELKEEIEVLKTQNNALAQAQLNSIVIRNLPKEIREDKKHVETVIENVFKALELDVKDDDYEAYAYEVKSKGTANISMKFSASKMRKNMLTRFKNCRRQKNLESFLVEKLIGLPVDHLLNGTTISIHNQLTQFNAKLLQYARSYVPSHFAYAFDSMDGEIKVKVGDKLLKVDSTEEIDKLVSTMGKNKQQAHHKNQGQKQTPLQTERRVLRSGGEGSGLKNRPK